MRLDALQPFSRTDPLSVLLGLVGPGEAREIALRRMSLLLRGALDSFWVLGLGEERPFS